MQRENQQKYHFFKIIYYLISPVILATHSCALCLASLFSRTVHASERRCSLVAKFSSKLTLSKSAVISPPFFSLFGAQWRNTFRQADPYSNDSRPRLNLHNTSQVAKIISQGNSWWNWTQFSHFLQPLLCDITPLNPSGLTDPPCPILWRAASVWPRQPLFSWDPSVAGYSVRGNREALVKPPLKGLYVSSYHFHWMQSCKIHCLSLHFSLVSC